MGRAIRDATQTWSWRVLSPRRNIRPQVAANIPAAGRSTPSTTHVDSLTQSGPGRRTSTTNDERRTTNPIVVPFTADTAPAAWFVEVRSLEEGRPRVTLVAFYTGQLPDGTIIDNARHPDRIASWTDPAADMDPPEPT